MASSSFLPEEDLTCPVCMDIFTDPITLKCSHVFCKACLNKCWEENEQGQCPMCREKTTENPSSNRVLKNLCEALLKNRSKKPASASEPLCRLHGEKLKLFCLNDAELICLICQNSEKHENHKLRPTQEAAYKYKGELEKALRPLQEKLEAFNEEKQESDQETELIKSQAESTALQIQKEFQKLHQFLQKEEEARLATLREEEEQKSQSMKERVEKITKEISSLTDAIRALEQEMEANDVSFLQNYKITKRRAQYQVSDPKKASRGRIDVARHLGNLKYRVWKKMKRIVQYSPVILDPNTKGCELTLSKDLTSLRCSGGTELSSDDDDDDDDDDDNDDDDDDDSDDDDDEDDIDDNDSDNDDDDDDDDSDDDEDEDDGDKYIVLGSEGLVGQHCWEVEVGNNPDWALGVAEKGEQDKRGKVWGICYDGEEYRVLSSTGKPADTILEVWHEVERVRVRLDCDGDRLSFSDPTNDTSLRTFRRRFPEQVFPLLSSASDSAPLRICPRKVRAKVGRFSED